MTRSMRTTTVLLLILLPFVALRAQDLVLEEEEEIRRYTVEIIIFKYAQEVATGSEIFPADEPVPEILPLDDLPLEEEIPPIVDMPEAELPLLRDIAFVLLEEENYTLDETMRRLERLEVYEPLMHFGWTQATWPEEETQPIELASLATPPAGLDGSLTLYLGRYLHLVVDLELDAEHTDGRNPALDDTASNYGDYRAIDEFGNVVTPGPVRYRIEENRILRSGELRYFDHPKFGVLAKAMRVEEETEDGLDMEETELLGYPIE